MRIFSIEGKVIKQFGPLTYDYYEIDRSEFAPGIYLLVVNGRETINTFKFTNY